MKTFPATLFDYNGVLVDDEHVHLAAFRRVLEPLGIALSDKDYWERYLGFDDVGAFRAILADSGRMPDDRTIRELVQAKGPVYLELARTELRGFDGAAALVRRRADAGPVAIVSGALRDEISLGLSFLGVQECVLGVVAAEDAPESKPDPSGYRLGVELLAKQVGEAAAGRALVIEDSLAGIEAAKSAGLFCCAVAHSYALEELERAGADAVFRSIADVTDQQLAELYRRKYAD